MDVICSGYRYKPFVNGRCYDYICQGCHETPCLGRLDEQDVWISYEYGKELHTVEELMSFGWEKKEAVRHIKAVKAAIKKKKKPNP
jgi:hypothetical protein